MKQLFEWRLALTSPDGPKSPVTRLVLLVMSLSMNQDGGSCYPSVEGIAQRSGLSKRATMEHIKKAVTAGWIRVAVKGYTGQGWRRHEYHPAIPKRGDCQLLPFEREGGYRGAEGGYSDDINVVTDGHLNSTLTLNRNSIEGNASVPPTPKIVSPIALKTKSKARAAQATPIADDYALSPEMHAFATAKGFSGDVDVLFDAFCDHWRGNGKRWKDWTAVWRNWVRREIEFSKNRNPRKYRGGIDAGTRAELEQKYAGYARAAEE